MLKLTWRGQEVLRRKKLADGRLQLQLRPAKPGQPRPRITVSQAEWLRDGREFKYCEGSQSE